MTKRPQLTVFYFEKRRTMIDKALFAALRLALFIPEKPVFAVQ